MAENAQNNKGLEALKEYRRKVEAGEIIPEKSTPMNPREKLDKHLREIEGTDRKPSRALAINATCYECQGLDHDKSWKWRIGNCEVPGCALYPVRPYQKLFGAPVPIGLAADMGMTDEEIEALRAEHRAYYQGGSEEDIDEE